MKCDRTWEVDALREGRLTAADAESFKPHMRTCEACHDRFRSDERLRALGQSLQAPLADELALRRMRASILRTANGSRAPRALGRWAVLAAALLTLAATALWVGRTPPVPVSETVPEAFAGTIAGDGLYERTRAGRLERVTLREGRVEVHVRHLREGERFLVSLPDGELEVRGTTFEVVVGGGSTQRVSVSEGWVALRLNGSRDVDVRAGESWTRPQEAAPAATLTHSPSKPSIVASEAGAPADPYGEAMSAYRSGDYALAASRFRKFVDGAGDAPEAEDACYLEAVSLARAGNRAAASLAARAFLQKYPASFHRKEATLLAVEPATPPTP